jgi:hypothetical protein
MHTTTAKRRSLGSAEIWPQIRSTASFISRIKIDQSPSMCVNASTRGPETSVKSKALSPMLDSSSLKETTPLIIDPMKSLSDHAAAIIKGSSKELVKKGFALLEGQGSVPQQLLAAQRLHNPTDFGTNKALSHFNIEEQATWPPFLKETLGQMLTLQK